MNKQIKELIEQAGFEEKDGHISIQGVYMFNTTRMEKFAELIVRECITRVEGCAVEFDDNHPNDQFIAGYNKGVSKTASQVKQHFEIE